MTPDTETTAQREIDDGPRSAPSFAEVSETDFHGARASVADADHAALRTATRVVVLGGGLGGVTATRRLERLVGGRDDIEVTLVSRDNFFVLTPLLFEACSGILPEVDPALGEAALRVLRRRGADVRAATPVQLIEPGRVHVGGETIEAGTVVLVAGIVPNPAASRIPVERDAKGRIAVDATIRSRSHANVWALGDCAAIPGPDGRALLPARHHEGRARGRAGAGTTELRGRRRTRARLMPAPARLFARHAHDVADTIVQWSRRRTPARLRPGFVGEPT